MIDKNGLAKVEEHLQDALGKGAEVTIGGKRNPAGDLFIDPTVLTGVTPDMLMAREETFGPLAPLFRFETEEEVIRLANDVNERLRLTQFGI
jgi:succinate-semialdehyde dehydrogenase/glutarate-semialdehyde dehydrogenase